MKRLFFTEAIKIVAILLLVFGSMGLMLDFIDVLIQQQIPRPGVFKAWLIVPAFLLFQLLYCLKPKR